MAHTTLKNAVSALALGAATLSSLPAVAEIESSAIDLTYVWTAHEGKEQQLIDTYAMVGDILDANEPGLLSYKIAISESGNQIVIHEVFENNEALAFHLTETAAKFFPQLIEFATPGPFIFDGDVAEELKMAAYGMNMGAIFTGRLDWLRSRAIKMYKKRRAADVLCRSCYFDIDLNPKRTAARIIKLPPARSIQSFAEPLNFAAIQSALNP